MKKCLSELVDFKQKKNKSIEAQYGRLNDLIFKCNQYGVIRTIVELNLTFVFKLIKEWKNIWSDDKYTREFQHIVLVKSLQYSESA